MNFNILIFFLVLQVVGLVQLHPTLGVAKTLGHLGLKTVAGFGLLKLLKGLWKKKGKGVGQKHEYNPHYSQMYSKESKTRKTFVQEPFYGVSLPQTHGKEMEAHLEVEPSKSSGFIFSSTLRPVIVGGQYAVEPNYANYGTVSGNTHPSAAFGGPFRSILHGIPDFEFPSKTGVSSIIHPNYDTKLKIPVGAIGHEAVIPRAGGMLRN